MLLSQLEFGSLFTYTPRPKNDEQKNAQNFVYALKYDKLMISPRAPITTNIAKHIASNITNLPFQNFFEHDTILIPIPSNTLKVVGALWVPYNLARALEAEKLGQVISCVERKNAITKSATAKAEERPTPKEHYESVEVKSILRTSKKIVLIDDVVTRGATAIGIANRIKEVYPDADIKLFAAVRTISDPKNFVGLVQPCIGEIKVINNQAFRNP